MAVLLNDQENINVTLNQEPPINTSLPDINYIPGYKVAEEERRANEVVRQANEQDRIALYEDMEYKVETGYFNGEDGEDGFSPIANVSKTGDTATITITDKDGTTTAIISDGTDGVDGQDGQDGYSPTATVTKTGKIATITITDKDGTTTAQIRDGEDGSGTGDMLKATYDTNDNGIVDNAEKVNNHTVESDVPSNAVFTDTTYTAGSGIDITNGVISNTQTSANWGNITGTLSDQTDLNTALSGKEDKTNKVTSLSNTSTDTEYPSAKAVYDFAKTLNDMPIFVKDVSNGGIKLTPSSASDDPVKKGIYIYTNTSNLNAFWFYGGYSNFYWKKDYDTLYKMIIVPEDIPYMDQTTYRSKANRWFPIIQDSETGSLDICGAVYSAAYGSIMHTKYISAVDNIYSGGFINLKGSQTISGLKTFSTLPQSSVVPSSNNDLVNKKYVDDNIVEEVAIDASEVTEDTKLYIEDEDLEPQGLPIANEYNTADNMAYSCEYANGTTLYESASGTTGTIALSDSLDNYTTFKIYTMENDNNNRSLGVYEFDTGKTTFMLSGSGVGSTFSAYTKEYTKGTNELTSSTGKLYQASSGSVSNYEVFKVYKVIGYK